MPALFETLVIEKLALMMLVGTRAVVAIENLSSEVTGSPGAWVEVTDAGTYIAAPRKTPIGRRSAAARVRGATPLQTRAARATISATAKTRLPMPKFLGVAGPYVAVPT